MSYRSREQLNKIFAITAIACTAYAAYKVLMHEKENKRNQRQAHKRKYEEAIASSSSDDDDVPSADSSTFRHKKRNAADGLQISNVRSVDHKFVACSSNQNSNKQFISKLSDDQFKKSFRVSRSTVDRLHTLFKKSPEYKKIFKLSNKTKIPDNYYILMFLWFVGQRCSYLELSKKFNVALSKSVTVVETVLQFLNNCANDFIRMPRSPDEMRMNAENFEQIAEFPGVSACIMHTKIKSLLSQEDPEDNNESTFVQAVCNSKGCFLDLYFDTTESHPSEVLDKSLMNDKLKLICQGRYHILAPEEYKIREWLLTPICEPASAEEVTYNQKHLQTYQGVSNSLEFLKKRFQKLNIVSLSSNKMKKMITACCVVQNICIEEEDYLCFEDPLTICKFVTKSETIDKVVDENTHLRRIGELKRKQLVNDLKKSLFYKTEQEIKSNIAT